MAENAAAASMALNEGSDVGLLLHCLAEVEKPHVVEPAVNHVQRQVEVRCQAVGGAKYQGPMQGKRRRQQSLACCWLIGGCREQTGRAMSSRLADELIAAYKKEGKAMATRDNTHR